MEMNDRYIAFEKIGNARDMGGLCTAQGHMISSGLLIRSANLSEATEADQKALREKYHLSKIIDLRTETEQKQMPDVCTDAVEYLSIPIFGGSVAGISHEKMSSYEQIFAVMPKLEQLYSTMVTDPSCRENLGKAAMCFTEAETGSGCLKRLMPLRHKT